jgi:hypothetical protein
MAERRLIRSRSAPIDAEPPQGEHQAGEDKERQGAQQCRALAQQVSAAQLRLTTALLGDLRAILRSPYEDIRAFSGRISGAAAGDLSD